MRILLAANASYVPPRGGATRSNLWWLERLAASGHACRAVTAALEPSVAERQIRDEGIEAEWTRSAAGAGVERFERRGVAVYAAGGRGRLVPLLREQIGEFQPDWVLISSEDLGHTLLREAARLAPERIIYLAHTPQFFPFGPASWNPDAGAAEIVRRAAAAIAICQHVADYVAVHAGRAAEVIHPPIYGAGPFPNLAAFDRGLVAMVNPCAMKGISIFLALADRLPETGFGALPGWGTTAADMAEMRRRPNITLLPNYRNIEDFLRQTRVLLMPSLWHEGYGLSVMEAMLRGIPTVASDSGGLAEAKLGTGSVVHVPEIERFEPVFDEHGMPRPVLPAIDIEPWVAALGRLLSDGREYERESERSRAAALEFVAGIRGERMEEFLLALAKPRLRVLLAQNSFYYPAHGGGDKSNRLLMEELAARGHTCRAVARAGGFSAEGHQAYLGELAARGVAAISTDGGVVVFGRGGVEVHVVTNRPNLRAYLSEQTAEFSPDIIVASTDDPAQVLLEAALRGGRARVVYLVRATLALPFGPDSAFPSAEKTDALRRADAVVGVSRYVAEYIRRWSGIEAVHVPISPMEAGPYPELGRWENEFVTLVNPCAVKGISIFLALADRMPEVRFAAVPTWGTTAADRAALAARPNIRILEPCDRIDDLLARTRVLLVPSLWAEARSRMIAEAMLRGVPVLAAEVGGIPEAMLGVGGLLPVRPIEKYRPALDERMVPQAEVPEQDIEPWFRALGGVLEDRAQYERLSRASREAALAYAASLSVEPFEEVLERVAAAPARIEAPVIERLTPERRRLLALRLRSRRGSDLWLPGAGTAPAGALRLFAFPHAGGGASLFHAWRGTLPEDIAVCPVRMPGRENRMQETPIEDMRELVAALLEAMHPYLRAPFAFYGHSMGAVVAFEVARALQGCSPAGLFVAGARAPQFRLGYVAPPAPTEEEFRAELQRMGSIPAAAFENPELLRATRADSALYRNYSYTAGPPLPCPIRAYGGAEDASVTREHLEAWACQTSGSFAARFFPGSHFFVNTARETFLDALAADIAEVVR
jgi:surfactin synthase thioesterase subunit/glycosyltransferase involved in cell wall biosynthesis